MRILWIPHTGWHIPQRAHAFCRSLSRSHEVHVTDWVADFSTIWDYVSVRYLRNFGYRLNKDGDIQVHGIPRLSPALYSGVLRRVNQHIFAYYVQQIIYKYKIDAVVGTFVVPPPAVPHLIFDLFDENVDRWKSLNPSYAREIFNNEEAYLRQAGAVVAASSVLVEKAKRFGTQNPIYHIPNGIDVRRFSHLPERPPGERTECVIGTIGNFDDKRQIERVLAVAEISAGASWTFEIAGRGTSLGWAQRTAQERGLSNVVFTGYVLPERLPEKIAGFDVGLCPYASTQMDQARCPMRLLAYAAAGLPSVCTDLEEVRRMALPNVVLVEDHPDAWVEGIKLALAIPHSTPPPMEKYDLERLSARYEDVICGYAH